MTCSTPRSITVYKGVKFGTLDISGASGTFTAGSAAPTVTEGGISRQASSPVLVAVETTLSATPGNFTITYIDQDNNVAETSGSAALTGGALRGTAGFFNALNGTDSGALQITGATRTGGTSPTGVLGFWHVLPITNIIIPAGGVIVSTNFLTDLALLHKLSAGDQLMFLGTGTTAHGVMFNVNYGAM